MLACCGISVCCASAWPTALTKKGEATGAPRIGKVETMTPSKPEELKIACVGAGYWGKNLIRNFDELGVLHLICDTDVSVQSAFEQQYPDARFCCSFSEVLADPSIDAVVIATPAEKHYTLAKEALLAGKHVFSEKPLDRKSTRLNSSHYS